MIIRNVLIMGSGLMGTGIAFVSAMSANIEAVIVYDVNAKALDSSRNKLTRRVEGLVKKQVLSDSSVLDKIGFTNRLDEFKLNDYSDLLVIEAVPENVELKQKVFKEVSDIFQHRDDVIITTNTSVLSCEQLGVHVDNKGRFAGLHFSNPVAQMRLVEVIRTNDTDEETLNALRKYVLDIGKVSVTCKDEQGFILNRLLVPYILSAVKMVEDGVATPEDIDTAMKLGAGYPLGPLELVDLIGLDTAQAVNLSVRNSDGRPYPRLKIIDKMVSEGKLGRKTGEGFYKYPPIWIKSKL
ncbi:putative 3-hydroxyacyl-CoA dehydrogenase F54C8.1 [Halotydeus destructor]|nr:putative 3-hydroxyacyl-CoA dehydrogenase F54C8.1 [Halotydeus destructor]